MPKVKDVVGSIKEDVEFEITRIAEKKAKKMQLEIIATRAVLEKMEREYQKFLEMDTSLLLIEG